MSYRRAVVPAVVGLVILTAVAFGPLVSGLSLASEPPPAITNEGTLTIESVDFPTNVTVRPASYGAANAYVNVPPASVAFSSISGQPTLLYRLQIPAVNYSFSTSHFLNADEHGPTYEATLKPMSVDKERFEKQRYPGVLTVAVHDTDGRHVAASQNITVQVIE